MYLIPSSAEDGADMADIEASLKTDTRSFRGRVLKVVTAFAFVVGLVASAEQIVTSYAPDVEALPLTWAFLTICMIILLVVARVAHLQNNFEAAVVGVCLLAIAVISGAVGVDIANGRAVAGVAPPVPTVPIVTTTTLDSPATTVSGSPNSTTQTTASAQSQNGGAREAGTTHLADLALSSGSGLRGKGTYTVGGVETKNSLLLDSVGSLDYRIPKGKTFRATFAMAPDEHGYSATLYVSGKREPNDYPTSISQFQAPSSGSIDIEVSVASFQVLELAFVSTMQTVLGDPRVE